MSSIAHQVREQHLRDVRQLTPLERLLLALSLGDDDLELYAAAHGVSRTEAFRALQGQRQKGRRFSRCLSLQD